MGVPRLVTRLKDAGLSVRETLCQANILQEIVPETSTAMELGVSARPGTRESQTDPLHRVAIIDGPSFAHWIFRLAEGETDSNSDCIAAAATYSACARKALGFLRRLKTFGIEIKAIFFDGKLPEGKTQTRLARMQGYANNLRLFNGLHERLREVNCLREAGMPIDLMEPQMQAARRSLPPPPFIVPAVIEALLDSEFEVAVYVVPDEADRFCAAAASEICSTHPGTRIYIFTDDSDLILFEAGNDTRVVLLNELVEKMHDGHVSLHGTTFRPSWIRSRCPDFLEIAFLMSQHPKVSFGQLQNRLLGSAHISRDPSFQQFVQQYHLDTQASEYIRLRNNRHQRLLLASLDPRVSEVVYEAEAPGLDPGKTQLDVYLPFLLEEPTRRSAWHAGSRYRHCAYVLLLQVHGYANPNVVVIEWRRSGLGVAATMLEGLRSLDPDGRLRTFEEDLEGMYTQAPALGMLERWRILALQCMLVDMSAQGLLMPSLEQLTLLLRGKRGHEWQAVHLQAMYEAVYYSTRMLKQILHYVSSLRRLTASESRLNERLRDLPSIADFLACDGLSEEEGEAKWSQLIDDFADSTGMSLEKEAKVHGKKHRRSSSAKEVRKLDCIDEDEEESGYATLQGNRFAMLTAG